MPSRKLIRRKPAARRELAFSPRTEDLELRIAPAIDLTAIDTKPYGVQLANNVANSSAGAGYTVTNLGDVAATGFQDVLIGAPTINRTTPPSIGSGTGSEAFLVFGSNQAGVGNVNWSTLTTQQRTGDLSQLGAASQTNPKNGNATFAYSGLTFVTGGSSASMLGASAAPVQNITNTGINAFLVGAPNSFDAAGDSTSAGTGRAYLVYGGSALQSLVPAVSGITTLNLDSTTPPTGQNVVTFWSNNVGIGAGTAVASVGNFLGDGGPDIAIAAPNASFGGLTANGAVFVIPGSFLRTVTTRQILLDSVGQPNSGVPGVVFIGAASGDRLGSSLANAGNVNGVSTRLSDLLIGAQTADVGAGAAYLVYGSTTMTANATKDVNGFFDISVGRLGSPSTVTGTIAGATFDGSTSGDRTGFAVAGAGDFNGDGLGDFMIGSPGFNSNAGLATLIYGQANNSSGVPGIVGTFTVSALPSTVPSVQLNGVATNAFAGFSLSAVQTINSSGLPEILIGSPGVNSNAGAAYLIPGQTGLIGSQNLGNTETTPLQGIIFTTSASSVPGYFGASVSGFINTTSTLNTLDADAVGDFVIGAPGFGFSGGVAGGTAYIVEGRFVPLGVPVSTNIPTQIGVGQPFGPFTINASTPASLQIFVFSNANVNPVFNPVTQIDTTTVVVNGVAYPNATIQQDPVDENGDGIPDAIITISPRSSLGLTNGTHTITISGSTLATSTNPNKTWAGSATVNVVGGSGGVVSSGVPGAVSLNIGFGALPKFGSSLVPSLSQLSKLNWRPLPIRVAYQQFQLPPGFALRIYDYFHPNKVHQQLGSGHRDSARGVFTLGNRVFTRDPIHAGKHFTFKHAGVVVPADQQYGRI